MIKAAATDWRQRTGWLLASLAAALSLLATDVHAIKNGDFVIVAAYADEIDGVYYLNATIDYDLNDVALEALARGVALTFELRIDVRRTLKWRPDKNVAELLQLYELRYHALSERYIVRNLNSGEQESFLTLAAALLRLGEVRELPVLDSALLRDEREYVLRLKTVLDIRSFPGPLRVLDVFFGDWRLASEWYDWRLPH
ncbi:MAG: DUF4390 domain-containing protein [Gammaproteobacteria bacterium]|nr:DUF4390 domain-containing protein [Gammaproteobacteria bacterium]NNF60348.1 DUF4390 domain-containing protein [Gammaproteobacteria bacterium]NNM20608.1 DUF4390 domain-containing protein [Gammaproteobacteria bacterium]